MEMFSDLYFQASIKNRDVLEQCCPLAESLATLLLVLTFQRLGKYLSAHHFREDISLPKKIKCQQLQRLETSLSPMQKLRNWEHVAVR